VDRRARLTPLGGVLLVLLLLAIVAVVFGSRALQTLGFIVLVVALLVLVADRLPRLRFFGRSPSDVLPTPEQDRRARERAARRQRH
jgi:membrane protein implicated in regulation of membrane protease activity